MHCIFSNSKTSVYCITTISADMEKVFYTLFRNNCKKMFSLQCFGTVGWPSGLLKVGCWFVDDDDWTGALHVL